MFSVIRRLWGNLLFALFEPSHFEDDQVDGIGAAYLDGIGVFLPEVGAAELQGAGGRNYSQHRLDAKPAGGGAAAKIELIADFVSQGTLPLHLRDADPDVRNLVRGHISSRGWLTTVGGASDGLASFLAQQSY